MASDARGSAFQAGLIMVVLAILLSWLPLLGPFIAGAAGGWIVADRSRALAIALIPAIVLAVIVIVVLVAVDVPVLGTVVGIGVFIAVVVQELPLLVGAWAGAAMAQERR